MLNSLQTGIGMIPLDWTVTFFVILTMLMNGAVLRDPQVVESSMQMISRRIILGAMAIFAFRYVYLLARYGDVNLPPISEIALLILMIGLLISCVDKMFPQLNEISEAQALAMIAGHEKEIARIKASMARRREQNQRATDPKPAGAVPDPQPSTNVPDMPTPVVVVPDPVAPNFYPDPNHQPDPIEGPQK